VGEGVSSSVTVGSGVSGSGAGSGSGTMGTGSGSGAGSGSGTMGTGSGTGRGTTCAVSPQSMVGEPEILLALDPEGVSSPPSHADL
jgi:hypothetical protein